MLCLVLAGLTAAPLVVSLYFGDDGAGLKHGLVMVVLTAAGAVLSRLRAPSDIQKNEAMVVGSLMFLIAPSAMILPMMSPDLSVLDTVFETVSGVTTTGLTTLDTISDRPASFLFTRAWMQWYGGLGIVVLSAAFVLQPGIVTRRLTATEASNDTLVGGMRAYARRAFVIYAVLTVLGILVLTLLGAGPFRSGLYTLAAVSTGGFAPDAGSLAGLPNDVSRFVVIALCLAGATSFTFYLRFSRHGFRELLRDLQLQAVIILGLVASVALLLILSWGGGHARTSEAVPAVLTAFSAQTTSGFSVTTVRDLPSGAKLLVILCMAVGGGAGSTAGGIKLSRLLIAARLFQVTLAKTCMPRHAVLDPRLAGRRLDPGEIQGALVLILVFVGVILLSWLPFMLAGYDPLDSLFEVVSATGTVGLSTGITKESLPAFLKILLCIDMFLGRLEIIPALVLVYPGTWFARRRSD
jgi:trk system potassium uptake protein TrkH